MDSTAEERTGKLEDKTAQMSQPEAQKEEKQTGKQKTNKQTKSPSISRTCETVTKDLPFVPSESQKKDKCGWRQKIIQKNNS